MSFKQVRAAALATALAQTSGYTELQNGFDIDDNPERILERGIAVIWGTALPSTATTKRYGFEASLLLTITNCLNYRLTDDKYNPPVDALYDDAEAIIKEFQTARNLGVTDLIRGVKTSDIERPELFKGGKFVSLTMDFSIDFHITLND